MSGTARQEIVVGVSGSRASVAALRWAADEAGRRHVRLNAICAWDPSPRPAPYAGVGEGHPKEDTRVALDSGLAAAVREAFGPVRPACRARRMRPGSRSARCSGPALGGHAVPSWWSTQGPARKREGGPMTPRPDVRVDRLAKTRAG